MSRCASLEPSETYRRKLFYKIAEVAEIVGVEAYVLRYWETRFPMLKPERLPNDERRYRQRDVDLLLNIRELLYQEKFTIPGAVERLKERSGRRGARESVAKVVDFLEQAEEAAGADIVPLAAVASAVATACVVDLRAELRSIRQELAALRGDLGD